MGTAVCELEVVAGARGAEHDAVESVVVLEAPNDTKAETTAVHIYRSREIADWPSDPKVRRHGDVRRATDGYHCPCPALLEIDLTPSPSDGNGRPIFRDNNRGIRVMDDTDLATVNLNTEGMEFILSQFWRITRYRTCS